MAELKLYLFGEPRIEQNGKKVYLGRKKTLAMLAYLALERHPLKRDILCALLWPDLDDMHARAALRSAIAPVPGSMFNAGDTGMLALERGNIEVDVWAFLDHMAASRAHKHPASQLCADCEPLLAGAVDLYNAGFMAGFSLSGCPEFDSWQMIQSEWLQREMSLALGRLVTYYRERGDFEAAFARAYQWLNLDRLHEPAHRELMRLFSLSGRRSDALRQYQLCVELLDSELASIPEDETMQLYEAIRANSADTRAVDGAHVLSMVTGILPPQPSLVIGRDEALHELKRRLGIGGAAPRPVTVVQGWPGVGKSTLIAALAHDREIGLAFPDGVLWASLGEAPNLLAELTTWANLLIGDEHGSHGGQRTIGELVTQLTLALRDRRMLLLVDDVWEVEHAAPFRVGGKACASILTSRLNEVAQQMAPTAADLYRLPILTDQAAFELLGKLSPETVAQFPDEAFQLVRDLEGLPLAIRVAGHLLHTEAAKGWNVVNLLQELREGTALLDAQAPHDVLQAGQTTSPTVAVLLRRSTDALSQELRMRFALLGVFVPKPATFDLGAMAAAWSAPDPKPYARALVNHGLVEPISGGRFQIHALLVMHARSLLDELQKT